MIVESVETLAVVVAAVVDRKMGFGKIARSRSPF